MKLCESTHTSASRKPKYRTSRVLTLYPAATIHNEQDATDASLTEGLSCL